jgi:Endonuclease-reverse transcriptase
MNKEIKVLHINVNRNPSTTEHILQIAIELHIQIVAVQEPWTIRNNSNEYRSINHSSFIQILPNYGSFRPRTLFYIVKDYRASLAPNSPKDPDCIIIDIEDNTQIINIYNTSHPEAPNTIPTIQRSNLLPNSLKYSTIILGDFNTHHPWWDPLRAQSSNSKYLLDLIEKYSLSLLNTPGEGTFYRLHMSIPSVLDLTFATQGIVNKVIDWQIVPDLGSDHFGVLFTIIENNPINRPKSNQRYNTKLANWDLFKEALYTSSLELDSRLSINTLYPKGNLDLLSKEFTDIIIRAADSSIPKTRIAILSKP